MSFKDRERQSKLLNLTQFRNKKVSESREVVAPLPPLPLFVSCVYVFTPRLYGLYILSIHKKNKKFKKIILKILIFRYISNGYALIKHS